MPRDSKEHAGNAVADVAFDDEADEEDGEQYAYERGNEYKNIATARGGVFVAECHYKLPRKVYDCLEQYCRQTTEHTYNDA